MSKVEFESKNKLGKAHGYVSGDSKKGLIVIQEWWGLEQEILEKGVEYSKQGFKTLVPDLYRGKVAKDSEEAGHLMNGLDWEGAFQDIQGAVDYLKSTGCEKVGVVGFCMGGALSLASSVKVTGLSCASFFYGIPGFDPKPTIPVQGHFGSKDTVKGFSDPEAVDSLEKKLKDANADFTIYRYEGAAHGFTNQHYHTTNYHEEATKLATQRVFEFMNKHL